MATKYLMHPKHVICDRCLELVLGGVNAARSAREHELVKPVQLSAPVKCCGCDRPAEAVFILRADDRHVRCPGAGRASECGRTSHARLLRAEPPPDEPRHAAIAVGGAA